MRRNFSLALPKNKRYITPYEEIYIASTHPQAGARNVLCAEQATCAFTYTGTVQVMIDFQLLINGSCFFSRVGVSGLSRQSQP